VNTDYGGKTCKKDEFSAFIKKGEADCSEGGQLCAISSEVK